MNDKTSPSQVAVNKIFGDSLPEITADERDERPADGDAEREDWLRQNVPPHHG